MRTMLLLSLLISVPSLGYAITGGELLAKCTAPTASSDRTFCDGYVAGVASGAIIASIAMTKARPELRASPPVFCMPASVPQEKLTELAVTFLRRNPASQRYSAASELILAFREAFPCGGE